MSKSLLSTVAFCVSITTLAAKPITGTATGVVDNTNVGGSASIPFKIEVGDPVTVTWEYDGETPVDYQAFGTKAWYRPPLSNGVKMSVTIAGHMWSAPNGEIEIANDNSVEGDRFEIRADTSYAFTFFPGYLGSYSVICPLYIADGDTPWNVIDSLALPTGRSSFHLAAATKISAFVGSESPIGIGDKWSIGCAIDPSSISFSTDPVVTPTYEQRLAERAAFLAKKEALRKRYFQRLKALKTKLAEVKLRPDGPSKEKSIKRLVKKLRAQSKAITDLINSPW